VEEEASALRGQNEAESREVEALFAEKQQREAAIAGLEAEIAQEMNMADNLVAAMQPELRDKFVELKQLNGSRQMEMERMQQELDALSTRKSALEDELAMSAVKREAVTLHQQLREAEDKRDRMLEEEAKRGTPQQERERLLQRVKDDNAEIATMERQIGEMRDKMSHLQEEQAQLDQDLEENQSERNQKYRELRKREENMDTFLAGFEANLTQESERLAELERQVADTAERMSRDLEAGGHLPTTAGFSVMRDDLAFKEREMEKSKNTLEGVTREHAQLQTNLEKVHTISPYILTMSRIVR